MLDRRARALLARPVDAITRAVDRPGITPDGLTLAGLGLGLASALAAGLQLWALALVLWLVSRVVDGVDGALARRRRADGRLSSESQAGGFLDITADFVVYGATVVGVAVGATAGFGAPWWPFLLVLLVYYVNGTAFLAFSSIAERTGRRIDDGRSLSFLGGLAEGTETIIVHALWLILPFWAWQIALVWVVVVGISATQRMVAGYRALR
ncbi:CDP-alcohol phosphatidyltransferase family protein [Microcella daejeonensis]|uniref:CDP-alcohol phosphatidyltransferase family protein n=1 Tax=Microcella daejeonensis TaxID=2994971 RepID=A0A9E8S7R7_9MICO|nr:CDP-alcohol phosphatidyltransferase family protein [Microcella daejeonensis]WAB80780.1 CDP-alcohol phosphatidyltransferase family protein [Microcella daejeonensis]